MSFDRRQHYTMTYATPARFWDLRVGICRFRNVYLKRQRPETEPDPENCSSLSLGFCLWQMTTIDYTIDAAWLA